MCMAISRHLSKQEMFIIGLAIIVFYSMNSATSQHRIVKRIIEGDSLRSQDDYGTYHFVELRKAFGCISNQATHPLKGCTEKHWCGGALIHPYFVLTASHCLTYQEFFLRNISDVYNVPGVIFKETKLSLRSREIGFFDALHLLVKVLLINPKFQHAIYSNIALLAGSVDFFGMEQKRHAKKVFHHPYYFFKANREVSYLNQDVALVQACDPFDISKTVKLAPMKPLDRLATQWESITKRMPACLYVGFGFTNNSSTKMGTKLETRYMQYTWRHVTCSTDCNYNSSLGNWDQLRNTCYLCSHAVPQQSGRIGAPSGGDSGSPVVCDGWYVGLHTGSIWERDANISLAFGFPLYCINDTITPRQLSYYFQEVPDDKAYHTIGPIDPRYYSKLNNDPE